MNTITVREIIEQWIESITKQVLLDVTEQQRRFEIRPAARGRPPAGESAVAKLGAARRAHSHRLAAARNGPAAGRSGLRARFSGGAS